MQEPVPSKEEAIMQGGQQLQDPNSEDVLQLVKTINEFNYNKTELGENLWLVSCVKKVTSQIVAGIKWRLDLTLGETTCVKDQVELDDVNSEKTKQICGISDGTGVERHYEIWSKPWMNFIEIISSDKNEV